MEDAEICQLITCKKLLKVRPKKDPAILKRCERNEFQLTSEDEHSLMFKVFTRKHCEFVENFSIGLDFFAKTGESIRLLRMNGLHKHQNRVVNDEAFENFHIHKATATAVTSGLKHEQYAEQTDRYRSFEEALLFFWEYVGIQDDVFQYFPMLNNVSQLKLQFSPVNNEPRDSR